MVKKSFISGVEKLINPITVGTLHFLQSYNQMLPVSIQNTIVEKASEKNPYMGFVVEPYGTFVFQKIIDLDYFKAQIPSNFELIKCSPFVTGEADYYMITSIFNARTSAFMGSRVEAYVIAENTKTGLTSWVIVDYITNTISHDNKFGLTSPSVKSGFVTTDFEGHVLAQMNDEMHKLSIDVNTQNGHLLKLDPKLWIEGNISVGYGLKYDDSGKTFALKFDPREMSTALKIAREDVVEFSSTWFEGKVESEASEVIVFKYAQHFVSDSPGYFSNIKSVPELEAEIKQIDFNSITPYSTDDLAKRMMFVPLIMLVIIIILLIM